MLEHLDINFDEFYDKRSFSPKFHQITNLHFLVLKYRLQFVTELNALMFLNLGYLNLIQLSPLKHKKN